MKNDASHEGHSHTSPSRRAVLRGSGALAAASVFTSGARATSRGSVARPVIVQVFLRGGMDGLTTVVPHGDPFLYSQRPTLAVPPPGATNGALDLDGFFGLAPAAAPLLTPYNSGHLAIVHATGSNDPSRSHFEAEARMEIADPAVPPGFLTTGWLARYLLGTTTGATGTVRAIGAEDLLPHTLRGAPLTLPIPDFGSFRFPGRRLTAPQREAAISASYARRNAPVGPAALGAIAAFGLGGIDFDAYLPENGAVYPNDELGGRMRDIAALIKGDIGVEAVTVDVQGWDLHAALGPLNGYMADLLDSLTRSLEAFYLDLLGHLDDYVLVCLSEFGRHVPENSSQGVDHGHGNAMFVMGGHVNGGQVIASWPGLADGNLDNGDLAITIDYRDVLSEILVERLGFTNLAPVFPQYIYTPRGVIT